MLVPIETSRFDEFGRAINHYCMSILVEHYPKYWSYLDTEIEE